MKAFGAAVFLWSLFVLAILFFDPGFQPHLLGCMRLVGRSVECEAAQQAISDAWWWLHVLPLLATLASGYIAIVALRVRNLKRRLPDRASGVQL